jgi:two-component system, sensor histidine kinase and response regulator
MRYHSVSNLKLFTSIIIPILAALLQWELWTILAPKTWIFLYPAVFFSASIGRLLGGLIGTCVATMVGVYVFIQPQFAWTISDSNQILSVVIFISMGFLFSLVFERLHRSTKELECLKDLELEIGHKRLSQALYVANAGVWEWTPETHHNEWSDSIWPLYGIEPHSCPPSYEAWFATVHPDDQQTVENMLNSAVEQGKELNLEWRVANMKPGQERWLMARGTPEFNQKGELLLYCGVVIDITERKRIELLSYKNEERLNFALETLHSGAWELDLNTLAAKRTVLHDKIFGYPELLPEWTYPIFLAHVLPDDRAEVDKKYRTAQDNQTDWSFVCRIRRADGVIRWISAKGRFSIDVLGQAKFCRGIVQDITEAKQAEFALAEKERLLSESQAIAHIGSWERHVNSGRGVWSDETFHLMGLSPDAGQPPALSQFLELIHPDDRDAVSVWYEDIWSEKQPSPIEFRTCLGHGEERWLISTGILETDSTGQQTRIIGTVQDITETKRLLAEKQRWADAFTHCAHGIVLGDPHTEKIITCNPAFTRMLGYGSPNEVQGMAILELYHPERRKIQKTYIEKSDEKGHNHYETVQQSKDGVGIDVQVDLVSVKDPDGKVLYRVATIQNITEKKRVRDELEQLNAELEERVDIRTQELAALNQSLESFVYSVSHDLKTPLRGIEGYSRLLQEDFNEKLDGEGKLFLQHIREGINRMNELIDDLLAYSRMSSRKLDEETVDIAVLLEHILLENSAEINKREIKIDISLPISTIHADKEGLALVFRNLLGNAFKFSLQIANPHIEIGADQDESAVTLWIKDNGVGFDMKYVDRIFEIFQRLHRLEDYPGTGIGLALVKTAMNRMGGRVWAESQPGQGATFYLELKQ